MDSTLFPKSIRLFKTYRRFRFGSPNRSSAVLFIVAAVLLLSSSKHAFAQLFAEPPIADRSSHIETPTIQASTKERALIREIIEPEIIMRLEPSHSKIIRTNYPIVKTLIGNTSIIDIQPLESNNEIEISGKSNGETTMTFWFDLPDGKQHVLRYLVHVDDVQERQRRRESRYRQLQSRINEMFPNSQVFLFPIEDKVIVRGQARDSKEAGDIMRMLGQSGGVGGGRFGPRNSFGGGGSGFGGGGGFGGGFGGTNQQIGQGSGSRAGVLRNSANGQNQNSGGGQGDEFEDIASGNFINMLRVPGVQQVMLKVRVAELVRNSRRSFGTDMSFFFENGSISHLLSGGGGNVTAILSDGDVQFFLNALGTHGYGKILAEPTLVAISGRSARFLAGGEFAVPTTVGIGGVGAASTTFRGFGTELQFTPTVVDKDLVRLQVSPSFSTLNNDATVGGIPGLNRRSVDTTVDLREGQWLAIAGLIQDEQSGQRTRLPFLGDMPFIGGFFGNQDTARFETELIVLVSPELVHPLEPEQVPLILPGMEVTDPTDDDFFLRHITEGYRGFEHRSTIWAEINRQIQGIKESSHHYEIKAGLENIKGKLLPGTRRRLQSQGAFICGANGLSN